LYPMGRVGAKGLDRAVRQKLPFDNGSDRNVRATQAVPPNPFERISWDEALDEIASRLKRVAAEFGSESILPYSYGGTLGKLGFGSVDRRFFHWVGASPLARSVCAEAGAAVVGSGFGVVGG